MDEISIKFGKGLAEPFTGKDGKEFMRILIPNQIPETRRRGRASYCRPRQFMIISTARACGPRFLQKEPRS